MRLQPPYGIIAEQLKQARVVPFLGAGASLVGRAPGQWSPEKPMFLPSARELAAYLADQSQFPSEGEGGYDLAKIASYYVESANRPLLRSCLRGVFNHEFRCNALHELLADIPAPLVMVATNYDTLLEQAFQTRGKPYDLMVYTAERADSGESLLWWPHGAERPETIDRPNQFQLEFGKRPLIFKIHGTVVSQTDEWDTFVITEEDYVDFLSRMVDNTAIPAVFYQYFRDRSFLFLGYSLGDWNLRVILKNLSRCLTSRRGGEDEQVTSWAIQLHPSELERVLWDKRHVRIYGMDLQEFVLRMKERLGFE
jgi:hypothetical protein